MILNRYEVAELVKQRVERYMNAKMQLPNVSKEDMLRFAESVKAAAEGLVEATNREL